MLKTENGIEKYNRDEFNSLRRFHQRIIATHFGIKPEKRTRSEEIENKVNRCRKKTLGYEGDTQDDYYWSDHRDLFEEIIKMEKLINLATIKIDCGCKDWKMFIEQDGYELPEKKTQLLHSCSNYDIHQQKKSLKRYFIKK